MTIDSEMPYTITKWYRFINWPRLSGTQQQKQYINQSKIRCMLGVTKKNSTQTAANTSETSWKAAKQKKYREMETIDPRIWFTAIYWIRMCDWTFECEEFLLTLAATHQFTMRGRSTFSNFSVFFSSLTFHPLFVFIILFDSSPHIFRPFIRSRISFSASFSNEIIALWALRPANRAQFIGDDRTTQFSGRTSRRKKRRRKSKHVWMGDT